MSEFRENAGLVADRLMEGMGLGIAPGRRYVPHPKDCVKMARRMIESQLDYAVHHPMWPILKQWPEVTEASARDNCELVVLLKVVVGSVGAAYCGEYPAAPTESSSPANGDIGYVDGDGDFGLCLNPKILSLEPAVTARSVIGPFGLVSKQIMLPMPRTTMIEMLTRQHVEAAERSLVMMTPAERDRILVTNE